MPKIASLGDSETLTYLHRTVSTKRHVVGVPDEPVYLDAILADTPLVGGLEPMLGETHLRIITVLGFPNTTRPGLLDALNHLEFSYRWMTRFIALDKTQATKTLTKIRRQWFAKRKSITALLREVVHNEPAQLLDSDADNKVADADMALQALGNDNVAFGYPSTTTAATLESNAQGRWQNTMSAFQQALTVQAQTAQNVANDTAQLSQVLNASQSATGNLDVVQASNQLLALSTKQQLQTQSLMAAQYRADALQQANETEAEEEGTVEFTNFLGSDTAYAPQ